MKSLDPNPWPGVHERDGGVELSVAVEIGAGDGVPSLRLDVVGIFGDGTEHARFPSRALLIEAALQSALFVPMKKWLEKGFFRQMGAKLVIAQARPPRFAVAGFEQMVDD